jgi:hypothetical protein
LDRLCWLTILRRLKWADGYAASGVVVVACSADVRHQDFALDSMRVMLSEIRLSGSVKLQGTLFPGTESLAMVN